MYFHTIFLYVLQIQKLFLVLQNINNLKLNIMKKLFLILLLLPLFCSSQVLFDEPMNECYDNYKTKKYSCFALSEGSKIYIEGDTLVIDIKTTIHKYKITDKKTTKDFCYLFLTENDNKLVLSYNKDLKLKKKIFMLTKNVKDSDEMISYCSKDF